ncbi:MAG: Rpn family recombination-promoting nuclease/putative transposase [bacterium]|nr:Rpn family recombination-promoting nuclease/putative transposase [bacterium]
MKYNVCMNDMDDMNNNAEHVPTPHNNLFEWTFRNVENTRTFLEEELPASIRKHLDLSKIIIEPTSYVSAKLWPFRSDIVVQVALKGKGKKKKYARIYYNI